MSKFKTGLTELSESLEAKGFNYGNGFNKVLSKYRHKIFDRLIQDQEEDEWLRVLEVGGANGQGTEFLLEKFYRVEVVEPVKKYCDDLSNRFDRVRTHNYTLEEWREYTHRKYDIIVAFNVLEHTENAMDFLDAAYNLLRDSKSKLVLTVPNAISLHRQLGVKMGIIRDPYDLAESDKMIGHRRYFDTFKLKRYLYQAGFQEVATLGNFFKPFPNSVMETIDEACYDGLHKVGSAYKEFSAEIFACALKGKLRQKDGEE